MVINIPYNCAYCRFIWIYRNSGRSCINCKNFILYFFSVVCNCTRCRFNTSEKIKKSPIAISNLQPGYPGFVFSVANLSASTTSH